MSQPKGLFSYPPQTAVGRVLPKSKVYDHAKPTSAVRALFVRQVEQITWLYKLAPETINLPAVPGIPELEIFEITLKTAKLDTAVLKAIDKAIPFPILFHLRFESRLHPIAAFKRPSDADSNQWVTSDYFSGPWQPASDAYLALPLALDLRGLYEQLLRPLLPMGPRAGETLRQQVERAALLRSKQSEIEKLSAKLASEKQFNRKVEINAHLRNMRHELTSLAA